MNNFFKLIEQFRTQVRRLLICMLARASGIPHACHGSCRLAVQHMHPGAGPPCQSGLQAVYIVVELCCGRRNGTAWHGHGHDLTCDGRPWAWQSMTCDTLHCHYAPAGALLCGPPTHPACPAQHPAACHAGHAAGRACVLRPGLPGHDAQHAEHRPTAHLEGALALVSKLPGGRGATPFCMPRRATAFAGRTLAGSRNIVCNKTSYCCAAA